MDVIFDEQALSQKLRLSGLYYTLNKKRPFQLDLQGAAPEDKQELDGLIAASGLEPAVDVMPSLKTAERRGRLERHAGYGIRTVQRTGTPAGACLEEIMGPLFRFFGPSAKGRSSQEYSGQ